MRVKICGLTRLEDARHAAAVGADALGFVLWPGSPRFIERARLRALVAELPPFVSVVGVFVDPDAGEILAARDAGIHLAQVHGRMPELPAGLPVLRALQLGRDGLPPDVPAAAPVLIDADDPTRRGGTGRTADWRRAAVIARTRPVVLAGGLTPDNVAAAVRAVRPWAVDVASGVERRPGEKDHTKLAAFVAAARAAT